MALLDVVDAVNAEDIKQMMKKLDDARHVLPFAERILRRILRHKTIYEHSICVSSVLTSGLFAIKRHGADDRSRCVRSFINTVAKVVDIDAWLEEPRAATQVQQACIIMDAVEHAIYGTVRMIAYFAREGQGEFFVYRVAPPLINTFRRLRDVDDGKYFKEFKAAVEHTMKMLHDIGTADSFVLSHVVKNMVQDAMNANLSEHVLLPPLSYDGPLVGCSYPFCRTVTDASEDKMMARIRKTCCSCRQANYCSKDCQKAHWGVHKELCMDALSAGMDDLASLVDKIMISRGATAREEASASSGDGQKNE